LTSTANAGSAQRTLFRRYDQLRAKCEYDSCGPTKRESADLSFGLGPPGKQGASSALDEKTSAMRIIAHRCRRR